MPKVKKTEEITDAFVYESPRCTVCSHETDNPITCEGAKQLLGWTIETADDDFEEFLVKDSEGRKIVCQNNLHNRPLYMSSVNTLKQEILRDRWRLNGEPIIIGQKGAILNGQHSLVALVLAGEEYALHSELYDLESEPTMEKLIVYGISEDDAIVNTMDTCKPRSIADVLFRSEYFAGFVAKDRKVVSRYLDYAIRIVWDRTGAGDSEYGIKRTHAEALDFVNRHMRLIDCIKFIFEENSESNAIGKIIGPGYAVGLLYLMSCGSSDVSNYSESSCDDALKFEDWELAQDFFVGIASGSQKFKHLREYLGQLIQDETDDLKTRQSVLIKSWLLFRSGKSITRKGIQLDFYVDELSKTLIECPVVGAIDKGFNLDSIEEEPEEEEITEEIIEAEKEKVNKSRGSKKKRIEGEERKLVYVVPAGCDESEVWAGYIVSSTKLKHTLEVSVGYAGAGQRYEVPKKDVKSELPKF